MNLGWQLRAGIRTQDCIPGAPPQSGLECEGPFSCSSHLWGRGIKEHIAAAGACPPAVTPPDWGAHSPFSSGEKKFKSACVLIRPPLQLNESWEWVSPTSRSYPSQVPPTPKLQIDLSSCVTLAVCSLSPPPLACFLTKTKCFSLLPQGCVSVSGLLGENYQALLAPPSSCPCPASSSSILAEGAARAPLGTGSIVW